MRLWLAWWRRIVMAVAAVAALATVLPTVPTAAARQSAAAARAAAETAIDMLTSPSSESKALQATPADFSTIMGYRPAHARLANGEILTVNPRGGCSVPGGVHGLDLETVCKAHDLGYDLLRYAQRQGAPLGPAARERIDAKFQRDLDAQCAAAYRHHDATVCDAVAFSFATAVKFNSWRQMDGPPIDQSGLIRTVGIGLLGVVGVGLVVTAGWRWGHRRLNPVAR